MRWTKPLVRHLRGRRFFYNKTFKNQTLIYFKTVSLVRLFYGISAVLSVSTSSWLLPVLERSQYVEPLWPFIFFPHFAFPVIAILASGAWILGSILAMLNPFLFGYRALCALGIFLIIGLNNSDGHFGHNWHAYMWTCLVFIFLPKMNKAKEESRRKRFDYVQAFWFAQFVLCTFYFMTGLWKVRGILECALYSELTCELSHKILTNIGARELVYYRKFAPLSFVLFEYPWIGFVSYIGTIWLHLVSMYFPFRLDTHLIFGILRSVFHLGTLLLFGVDFSPMILTAVVLFAFSPFQPTGLTVGYQIYRLPPFGWISTKVKSLSALLRSSANSFGKIE